MKSTIQKFYLAFNELDAEAMNEFYHDEIIFQDPAFGTLQGEHARNMWRMLCKSQRNRDFRVIAYNFEVVENQGKARWEAFYTFTQTGRKVHNIIDARFEFRDGKISRHRDEFDVYRWARQAMGLKGLLFGWSPFFRQQLNARTKRLLEKYEQNKNS